MKTLFKKDIIKKINNREFSQFTSMCELKWKDFENGEKRAWLNPNNQLCYNFGWFTKEDFENWVSGTGDIIRGNTQEEKDKFLYYANLEATYQGFYSFIYNIQYFDLINENYNPARKSLYDTYIESPLKVTKSNSSEIIGNLFGYVCSYYVDSFASQYLRNPKEIYDSHSYRTMEAELWGVKWVCYNLGLGFYGACNTPCQIENLNWFVELTKVKSLYLALLKNGVEMPDFEFINKFKKY